MVVWGALASMAGSAAMGAVQSHKATTARRTMRRRLRRVSGRQEAEERKLFGEERRSILDAMRERTGGYERALGELGTAQRATKRQATDLARQQQAGIQSALAGTGFTASTRLASGLQGVGSRLQRTLADIDAQFAGLAGELEIGRGEAAARGHEQLAGLTGRKRQSMADIWRQRYALWGGAVQQPQPMDLSGLGGIFDELIDDPSAALFGD